MQHRAFGISLPPSMQQQQQQHQMQPQHQQLQQHGAASGNGAVGSGGAGGATTGSAFDGGNSHHHQHQQQQQGGGDVYEPLLASRPPAKRGLRRKTWLLRGIGVCVLLAAFLATSLTLGRGGTLHKLLIWVQGHRVAGLAIFAGLYIWATVFFFPPALLAAGAGALYGFLAALPVVWACAVAGETLSFLLGRFLLRKWVRELTADWPMWLALNAALAEDGWKLVALLRLSPATPFSVVNYALGSSSLPFPQYFWPSLLGILPGLLLYIWLGSLAADVTEAVAGGGVAAPPAAKLAALIVCGVSAVAVVAASGVYTKRAIDARLAGVDVREQVRVEETHLLALEEGGGAADGAGLTASEDAAGLVSPPAGAATQQQQRNVLVSVEAPVRFVASHPASRRLLRGSPS